MPDKTALITGAGGQDGSLLGELLLGRGYRVVGVVRDVEKSRLMAATGVELESVDLCDPLAVGRMLERERPDEIYHLAADHHSSQETAIDTQLAAKRRMLATNFLSTQTIAFALLERGIGSSLVYAGSSQMYTAVGHCDRITESTPRCPRTFYGHVKSWSAELLAQLRKDFGLRAGTAILFNHESARRGPQFVSRKITRAAAMAREGLLGGRLEILNTRARVDWSSASDVVHALHCMAMAADARDYVVASGTLHSVEDLLAVAFGHCGLDWREHTTVLGAGDEPALCGDPGLIERTLGWRPAIGFEKLIRGMVDHDLQLLQRGARPSSSD